MARASPEPIFDCIIEGVDMVVDAIKGKFSPEDSSSWIEEAWKELQKLEPSKTPFFLALASIREPGFYKNGGAESGDRQEVPWVPEGPFFRIDSIWSDRRRFSYGRRRSDDTIAPSEYLRALSTAAKLPEFRVDRYDALYDAPNIPPRGLVHAVWALRALTCEPAKALLRALDTITKAAVLVDATKDGELSAEVGACLGEFAQELGSHLGAYFVGGVSRRTRVAAEQVLSWSQKRLQEAVQEAAQQSPNDALLLASVLEVDVKDMWEMLSERATERLREEDFSGGSPQKTSERSEDLVLGGSAHKKPGVSPEEAPSLEEGPESMTDADAIWELARSGQIIEASVDLAERAPVDVACGWMRLRKLFKKMLPRLLVRSQPQWAEAHWIDRMLERAVDPEGSQKAMVAVARMPVLMRLVEEFLGSPDVRFTVFARGQDYHYESGDKWYTDLEFAGTIETTNASVAIPNPTTLFPKLRTLSALTELTIYCARTRDVWGDYSSMRQSKRLDKPFLPPFLRHLTLIDIDTPANPPDVGESYRIPDWFFACGSDSLESMRVGSEEFARWLHRYPSLQHVEIVEGDIDSVTRLQKAAYGHPSLRSVEIGSGVHRIEPSDRRLDVRDEDLPNRLMEAAQTMDAKTAKELIEHGADVSVEVAVRGEDRYGRHQRVNSRPLAEAVKTCHIPTIQVLCAAGATPTLDDVAKAVELEADDVVQVLVSANSETLENVLLDAARRGNESMLHTLLSLDDPTPPEPVLEAALIEAVCYSQQPKAAIRILDAGLSPSFVIPTLGRSLLHVAVEMCDEVLLSYLLEKGADTTVRDPNGRTPVDQVARLRWSKGAELFGIALEPVSVPPEDDEKDKDEDASTTQEEITTTLVGRESKKHLDNLRQYLYYGRNSALQTNYGISDVSKLPLILACTDIGNISTDSIWHRDPFRRSNTNPSTTLAASFLAVDPSTSSRLLAQANLPSDFDPWSVAEVICSLGDGLIAPEAANPCALRKFFLSCRFPLDEIVAHAPRLGELASSFRNQNALDAIADWTSEA